jgi:hypothetical protein
MKRDITESIKKFVTNVFRNDETIKVSVKKTDETYNVLCNVVIDDNCGLYALCNAHNKVDIIKLKKQLKDVFGLKSSQIKVNSYIKPTYPYTIT